MLLLLIIQFFSVAGMTICFGFWFSKSWRDYAYVQFNNALKWRKLAFDIEKENWGIQASQQHNKVFKKSLLTIANHFRVQANEKGTGKYIYLTKREIINGDFSRTTKHNKCN